MKKYGISMFTPEWSLVLNYEWWIRQKMVSLITLHGKSLSEALKAARLDQTLKQTYFQAPLNLQVAHGRTGPDSTQVVNMMAASCEQDLNSTIKQQRAASSQSQNLPVQQGWKKKGKFGAGKGGWNNFNSNFNSKNNFGGGKQSGKGNGKYGKIGGKGNQQFFFFFRPFGTRKIEIVR